MGDLRTEEIADMYGRAAAEARSRIRAGLIQGAVFGRIDGPLTAVGLQCVHPAEKPMTEHSRFDIASVGKVFTAGCCALLVADGKLDPDAPFTEYLPEHELGKKCTVTVRDLAMHVGGFDNSKPYCSADMAVFHRELFHKRPVRPRLAAFEYACSNYILLGMIAERVSGMDLEALAGQRIWKPLGMKHTCWSPPGTGPDEVEHWLPNRPAGQHNDEACYLCPFPIGNGSCFSTAGDLLLFARDLLERKCFPGEYYRLMTTCGFEQDGIRRSFGWDMSVGHRPRNFSEQTIYHSGWTGQLLCVDPENGFAAVVLTSRTGDWDAAYAGRVRMVEQLYGMPGGRTADGPHLPQNEK